MGKVMTPIPQGGDYWSCFSYIYLSKSCLVYCECISSLGCRYLSFVAFGVLVFLLICWKVEITWDETDHERITTLNRKFKKEELLDMDFQAYLASSSEDEEETEEELQGTC